MAPTETFVVVGAGLAAGKAVQELREDGFEGHIVLYGAETHPACADPAGPHGIATPVRGFPKRRIGCSARKVRPKCALRRILKRQRAHADSRHRRSEPVFSSSATHSTWCVIGKRSNARRDPST